MSNAVSGIIEKVHFRLINQNGSPNQWQKTHRCSIKLAGEFYGCGEVKVSPRGELQLRVQNGKDWVTLEEGDSVQFFAKSRSVNGKTYYDKDGQIKLVAKGNGAPPATATPSSSGQGAKSSTQAAPAASGAKTSGGDDMQTRITNGMLLNNAVAYVVSQGVEPAGLEEAVVSAAGILRKAYNRICGGEQGNVQPSPPATQTATSASEPAPAATPAPASTATAAAPASKAPLSFEDDDIPF